MRVDQPEVRLPVPSKYPLSQVLEMRKAAVRDLERRLASAVVAANPATARVAELQKLIATVEQMLTAEQQRQFARMAKGAVLAHEVIQGAAHHARTRAELKRLQQSLTVAKAELETLRNGVRNAERMLAIARQKLAAIERHKIRHDLRATKLENTRTEDDATEAWQALRTAGKPEGEK